MEAIPLDEDPYADWSCHLFDAGRTHYIILSDTQTLYSCVLHGRGINNNSVFIQRAISTIRQFTEDVGVKLNDVLLSVLGAGKASKCGKPNEAFKSLASTPND